MIATDSPCTRALASEFGTEILTKDGGINRTLLASIVFCGDGAEQRRNRLNEITHAFILSETRRALNSFAANGTEIAIVDAPVLFESGFDKECDITVCVLADKDIRLKRIMERDGITMRQAENRIDSQKSNEELIALSDFYIENNTDLSELRGNVLALLEKLK